MPELPEVQTTVQGLQKHIVNKTIVSLWCNMFSSSPLFINSIKDKRYFYYFEKSVCKANIIDVRRRAKYILITLDNNKSIIIHMKMTGHIMHGIYEKNENSNDNEWAWKPKDKEGALHDSYNRHIRVVFTLSDKKENISHMVYCDSRKFGNMYIFPTDEIHTVFLSHLGQEPLEKSFTKEKLMTLLSGKKQAIKTTLMNQTIIAGIGNIYSDEMLHRAHILPMRITSSLSEKEIYALHEAMKEVLTSGIYFGGDSMSDYRNIDGEKGKFQEKHMVYLRKNKTCLQIDCTGVITKTVLGGRSSHYCTLCQK